MRRHPSREKKYVFTIFCIVIILILSFVSGATSAPESRNPTPSLKSQQSSKPQQLSLEDQLKNELPIVTQILVSSYPKISTDYDIADTKLYDNGTWFGATLRYKGSDTANRDTLRVLVQKKDNVWIIRTKPPTPLLSAKNYPDVPKSILQDINKVVGLP